MLVDGQIIKDIDLIQKLTAQSWGYEFNNNCRKRKYILQRASYYLMCRKYTNRTLVEIAESLGLKHCTLVSSLKKQNEYMIEPIFREKLSDLNIAVSFYFIIKEEKRNKKPLERLISLVANVPDFMIDEIINYRIIPYLKMNLKDKVNIPIYTNGNQINT